MLNELSALRSHHDGNLHRNGIESRRALLRHFRQDRRRRTEEHMLPAAIQGRIGLVDQNAPRLLGALDLLTNIRLETTLSGFLNRARLPGDAPRDFRRRAEATMLFDAACALELLEERTSLRGLKNAMRRFADEIEAQFFVGGHDMRFWSVHDPQKHYHTVSVGRHRLVPGSNLLVRPWKYFCREINLGSARGTFPVIFDHRVKERFPTYLKGLKNREDAKRADHPFEIFDQCGLKFHVVHADRAVAESRALELLCVLEQFARAKGGRIVESSSGNLGADASRLVDPHNPVSSKRYRAAKFIVSVYDAHFEVQVQTLHDLAEGEMATDDVNHRVYRLGQCLTFYFPWLFPEPVYGINWASSRVRTRLVDWRIGSLNLLSSSTE